MIKDSDFSLKNIRKDYSLQNLDIQKIEKNPLSLFDKWIKEAIEEKLPEPTAMHLSTVSKDGKPTGRIVLLKEFNETGFIFFTNYESKKGTDIKNNPNVALSFHWAELERQVRINGKAEKVSREISENYFHSRPRASQIGAWVSPQSNIIENDFLISETERFNKLFENKEIPLPDNWGGYIVSVDSIEFWQGRPSRLHDRILYIKREADWLIERLAP